MSKYLVTGASGFVGLRLLECLKQSNSYVRILSRTKIQSYDFIDCDFEKDEIPASAFHSIDTVLHLAGIAHDISGNDKSNSIYKLVNVDVSVDLAKKAALAGVKKFIYISSVKAGGKAKKNIEMNESSKIEPDDIYGITKRDAELKLLDIGSKLDMQVSIIRPSLLYGPNMKGNLNSMMSAIKSGWFPPLPRINNKRSLVHVDDLVRAIIFIATNEQAKSEIYILTDGKPHSSREIYEVMCNILGKSIPYWSMPIICFRLISFINHKYARRVDKLLSNEHYSSKKIQSLGFKPKFSLKDMNETSF